MKVLVIGSGTMGAGIAQVIAEHDIHVILNDIKDEFLAKGLEKIDKSLTKLVTKQKISEDTKKEILNRIETTTDLEKASNVDLVIEAAVENMEIKKQIFSKLDGIIQKDAIFATNTSSLSITEIATATTRPDKFIGIHFFNPAPVMKLVELIKGLATSDKTYTIVYDFIQKIAKDPVEVKEAPGFVVNRILIPMINEAIGVLADGVASVEDIDKAMMLGANHPMGPLALSDFIGNDIVLSIMEVLFLEFGDPKYRPHPYLRKMVRGNMLGKKTMQGFYNYNK